MLLPYIIIIFVIIFSLYQAANFYFCAKKPWCMMLLGFFDIIIATVLNSSVHALIKTKLPIFKDLVTANYVISISIAAIGANIIAAALFLRAEHTVKEKEKEYIKKLKCLNDRLVDYDSELKTSQSSEKTLIINRKVETEEEIYRLKKRLDLD